jgi:hypothetical protein
MSTIALKKSVRQFILEASAFFVLTFILSLVLPACGSPGKEAVRQTYQDALIACVAVYDTPPKVKECWSRVDSQYNISTDAGVSHD